MMQFFISYLAKHKQACVFSFRNLLRTPLASLMTIAVIAIALALPACLWVSLQNVKILSRNWQKGTQLSVFLSRNLSQTDKKQLEKDIQKFPQVAYLNTITPKEGLAMLEEQGGMQDVLEQLPFNPLPPVIEVFPRNDDVSDKDIIALTESIKTLSGVDLVKLDMQWVKRLFGIMAFLQQAMDGVMTLLALAVVLVIGNTIRLATENRRKEIAVLKLIGATNRFIRRPFLYTGMLYGLLGAVVAWGSISGLTLWLQSAARRLAALYHTTFYLQGMRLSYGLSLLFLGGILGYLGARMAVSRQIRILEPK